MRSITEKINSWELGDEKALDELILQAYDRLHSSARRALGDFNQNSGTVLQPTEMVNEFYCYLRTYGHSSYENSAHFFAIASLKLRQIIQEKYRRKKAKKRDFGRRTSMGGDTQSESDEGISSYELVICSEAFERLNEIDHDAARLLELKFLWEFSNHEIQQMLGMSESTYYRKWTWVKAWLINYRNDLVL